MLPKGYEPCNVPDTLHKGGHPMKQRLRSAAQRVGMVIAATVLTLVVSGCTPAQVQQWMNWHRQDPAAARTYALHLVKDQIGSGQCGEWYGDAIAAGFSDPQWPTVDQIMAGESGCDPSAYNPAGAHGLMQIMSMWADDCGTSQTGLFDPDINLRCAKLVHDVQGWSAWQAWDGHASAP